MMCVSLIHFFINFNMYSIYYECLFTISSFIIILLLSYSKKLKIMTNKIYAKILNMKYITIVLLMFSFFIFLMGIVLFLNMKKLNVSMLLILLIIMSILVLVSLVKLKFNEEENAIFLKHLKENNDFYIKIDDENRIFKHNLNAKLMSIKSISNVRAKKLIDELIKTFAVKSESVNKIKFIPYGLNGIIYERVYPHLEDLNIEIENNIDYDIFKMLLPKRYNVLVEKIIIILDNAIEACLLSEKRLLLINTEDIDDEIVINIYNTYNGCIDVDRIGKINYSTKGNKRGLGLFSVLRSNEVVVTFNIKDDIFFSKICAKKKKT